MPPSRSGDRLHFAGEPSLSQAARVKASRVPAAKGVLVDGKAAPSVRRALGDVSNFDKVSAAFVHSDRPLRVRC